MYFKEDNSTGVLEGQWYLSLILSLALWLGACQGPASSSPVTRVAAAASPIGAPTGFAPALPPGTATPRPSPTPLLRLETTGVPATTPAPVASPLPTATLPPTQPLTPTATLPSPPFAQIVFAADAGQIESLWPTPAGALWVLASGGLYQVSPGGVEQLSARRPLAVLGVDGRARIWVLFAAGEVVGAYGPGGWTYYGAEQGWEAAPAARFARSDEVVLDREGGVWLALGREGLRRLDPETSRWASLAVAGVSFAPPPAGDAGPFGYDSRLAFTDVALDSFGNVWVAACAVRVAEGGPQPLLLGEGQGARWFDGNRWAGPDDSGARCVYDLEVDGEGKVWLAGPENDLWHGNVFLRYEPAPGRWVQVPVPESETVYQENPRYVRDFWFDGQGRPWMHVERRGGATLPPDAVYYREDGMWQPFLSRLAGKLAGGNTGHYWLWQGPQAAESDSGLYRYGDAGFEGVPFPAAQVDPATLAVDGQGRAWFAGRERRSLWYSE